MFPVRRGLRKVTSGERKAMHLRSGPGSIALLIGNWRLARRLLHQQVASSVPVPAALQCNPFSTPTPDFSNYRESHDGGKPRRLDSGLVLMAELMASIRSWLRSSCLAENRSAPFDSPLQRSEFRSPRIAELAFGLSSPAQLGDLILHGSLNDGEVPTGWGDAASRAKRCKRPCASSAPTAVAKSSPRKRLRSTLASNGPS